MPLIPFRPPALRTLVLVRFFSLRKRTPHPPRNNASNDSGRLARTDLGGQSERKHRTEKETNEKEKRNKERTEEDNQRRRRGLGLGVLPSCILKRPGGKLKLPTEDGVYSGDIKRRSSPGGRGRGGGRRRGNSLCRRGRVHEPTGLGTANIGTMTEPRCGTEKNGQLRSRSLSCLYFSAFVSGRYLYMSKHHSREKKKEGPFRRIMSLNTPAIFNCLRTSR